MEILVTFAFPEEALFFDPRRIPGSKISTLITGMGAAPARKTFMHSVQTRRPDAVISCGFAGALDPRLRVGDLLFDIGSAHFLEGPLTHFAGRPGTFHFSDRVLTTEAEKKSAREIHQADAVEMESGVILDIARQHQIPCAILRSISDTSNDALPVDFNQFADADGRLKFGSFLLHVATHPLLIPGLLRLQKNSKAAARTLASGLHAVLAALPEGRA